MRLPPRHSVPVLLISATAALAAWAGPYSQPYALFEPDRASPTSDTRPGYVVKIDGHSRSTRDNTPVPPGKHEVVLSLPSSPGMSNPGRSTLTIEAEPCVRYLLAAKRSSRTATDWEGFVVRAEPIGECRKKFGVK